MAEPSANKGKAGGEDPSMEEILQSIRSIIAEEGEEGQASDAKPKEEEVPGSDVLELTEMVKEDGTVVSLKNGEDGDAKPVAAESVAAPAATTAKAEEKPPSADVLSHIEEALATAPAAAAPAPAAAPAAKETATADDDGLLSAEAKAAAAQSIKKLEKATEPPPPAPIPSPAFRTGNTVEDLVAEMIKPMIKEWLDKNLPAIVERIVEREVRRISK